MYVRSLHILSDVTVVGMQFPDGVYVSTAERLFNHWAIRGSGKHHRLLLG